MVLCLAVALFGVTLNEAFEVSIQVFAADETTTIDNEVKKTDDTLQAATDWNNTANLSKARILSSSANSQIGEPALRDFENLAVETKSLVKNDLFTKLSSQATQLEDDAKHLELLRKEYCDDKSQTFDKIVCSTAKARFNPQIDKLREKKMTVDKTRSDLLAGLRGAYQTAQDFSDNFAKNLSEFGNLDQTAGTDEIIKVLPTGLPTLANVMTLHKRMGDDWSILSPSLLSLIGETSTNDQVKLKLGNAEVGINRVTGNLRTWLTAVSAEATIQYNKRNKLLSDVLTAPAANAANAANESINAENFSIVLGEITDGGNGLKNLLKDPNFDTQIDNIEQARNQQTGLVARLQDAAVGDYANFEGDFVPLYYFTDVPNLMRIINPQMQEIRDKLGLREIAEQKRRELRETEIILSDRQAAVSGLQDSVRRLREELDNAERAANSTFGLLEKAKKRLAGIGKDDVIKLQTIQQEVDQKTEENTAAKNRLEKLQDQNNGLPAKIGNAEANLLEAQESVRSKRTALILLTQTESEAFANARDSETVYFAPIVSTSRDPLKRVFIYSFGNRKIVYLRGKRENINEAKKIIALLDRPAPQARMTLWTLELNGEATIQGSKKFNRALEEIEGELSNTRLRIAASLSFFRDAVNREVNRVAYETMRRYSGGANPLKRDNFQDLRWARLHFYQNEVLLRFGVDLKDFDSRYNQLYLSRIALPDPAGTSTLGEALIVLTLANPVSRQNILNNFRNNVADYLDRKLGICSHCKIVESKCPQDKGRSNSSAIWFPAIYRAMGGDLIGETGNSTMNKMAEKQIYNDNSGNFVRNSAQNPPFMMDFPDNLTAQQKEIVEALLSAAHPRIINRIKVRLNLYVDLITYKKRTLDKQQEIKNVDESALPKEDKEKLKAAFEGADETLKKLNTGQIPQDVELLKFLLKWLWREADLDENKEITSELKIIKADAELLKKSFGSQNLQTNETQANTLKGKILGTTLQIQREIKFLESRLGREQSLNTATARVARVDLMLKQMIDAMDEDVDRHFIQPMMSCLRTDLVEKQGISVGIVDRTSILATNRLLARVDGRSSAQLAVGEEQDVLTAVKQLTDVFLATKTSGVFGTLDSLNGLPNKDTSEIYGLTNGSLFKVTPIFDPTGQTLRFKFDYGTSNLVQEPNGSINPQLPRIERHTVNTEVELNNMELREISRFNTNARIGIPTKKSGGVPLVKDIPGMDKVPLLGWFTRRAGKNAVIQESLIFGQTTMYPTIGDLYELLHGSDYEELKDEENENNIEDKSQNPAANPQIAAPN